ncbi:MAG: hypothetical protein JNK65_08315, partial [Deltaproteobacteria bacterium]|nr:hypothetical protein [Deltaproteobacteria bacterium]
MSVYKQIVWDLLQGKGDAFERRLTEHLGRVRSQASSQNFAYGLLEPSIQYLIRRGMILRKPNWNFTVEGITGLPHVERRWNTRPPFVEETLAWVENTTPPEREVEMHPSGMRHHALDVARDRIKIIEDRMLLLSRARARAMRPIRSQDIREGIEIGRSIVRYLRQEASEIRPFHPDRLERMLSELDASLIYLSETAQRLPQEISSQDPNIEQFMNRIQTILVHMRTNFDARSDLTHWNGREVHNEIQSSFKQALKALRALIPRNNP